MMVWCGDPLSFTLSKSKNQQIHTAQYYCHRVACMCYLDFYHFPCSSALKTDGYRGLRARLTFLLTEFLIRQPPKSFPTEIFIQKLGDNKKKKKNAFQCFTRPVHPSLICFLVLITSVNETHKRY